MTDQRTMHFDMSEPYAFDGETQRYVMFSFFSFQNGKLHIGQCQSVREDQVAIERSYLEKNGRTHATYRYVDGKPVLVLR